MTAADERLRQRLAAVGDWPATSLRRAAVVCPLVGAGGRDELLFVVRRPDLAQHAGQVAFPGGMQDAGETPLETALRECHEEIGAPAAALRVLGALPPHTSSTGILVQCLVARLLPVALVPDPREVARLLQIPLDALADPVRWQRLPATAANSTAPPLGPSFRWEDEVVWGLTARFVRDLLAALDRRLP